MVLYNSSKRLQVFALPRFAYRTTINYFFVFCLDCGLNDRDMIDP